MDELNVWPHPGVDTLIKALNRLATKMPNHPFFGTREGDEYKWMTVKEIVEQVRELAAGMDALNLMPTVSAEGKDWKFVGI